MGTDVGDAADAELSGFVERRRPGGDATLAAKLQNTRLKPESGPAKAEIGSARRIFVMRVSFPLWGRPNERARCASAEWIAQHGRAAKRTET